jgi:hypothetical protein
MNTVSAIKESVCDVVMVVRQSDRNDSSLLLTCFLRLQKICKSFFLVSCGTDRRRARPLAR